MLRVRDLMSRDVATLDVNDTLDLADDIMRLGRVRHFPILDAGKVAGVLSQRDLFRAASSSLLQLEYQTARHWLATVPVKAVMSTTIHAIGPDRPVRDAVDMLVEHKIGCLPVVENDTLVGLLSETDCLQYLSRLLALADERQGLPELPPAE
ncbi:MAG TPA: CBS domain-containing protein [Candidatus Eisenbacteria bacterium]|nr:CBS domain-containing protein [Candidatus Eisenbacteria bacterium]